MDSLMKSKSISNKLDGLLKRYALKVKKDQFEQSKVVDREQFKRELKQKILREVEGIRSFGHKESLLGKVNQKELNKIIKKIKKKLAK
jgi:CRISPR/Cas system-associated protein Cas5 (RAMP superfamily)